MSAHEPFLFNAWYPAAESADVGRQLCTRTLLEQRLVLYRTEAGEPVALRDRCPHRFAPLSLGQLHGHTVACPYHGMRFGPDGRCTRIPGQARVPEAARTDCFPVIEAYGLVFVWMGDPALADPARLVSIPQYGQPGWAVSRSYSLFHARWLNLADNFVDPAHTSFVHTRTIGNSAGDDVPVSVSEEGDTIICGRWIDGAPAVPVVRRYTHLDGPVDRWQVYHFQIPTVTWVDFGAFEAGRPHTEEEKATAPYRVLSYGFIAPATRQSTHYFSFQLRNFAVDDEATTREFASLYELTFEEDKVLLEAIEEVESASPGVAPLRIASDAGVVRMRRRLAEMMAQERSAATGGTACTGR